MNRFTSIAAFIGLGLLCSLYLISLNQANNDKDPNYVLPSSAVQKQPRPEGRRELKNTEEITWDTFTKVESGSDIGYGKPAQSTQKSSQPETQSEIRIINTSDNNTVNLPSETSKGEIGDWRYKGRLKEDWSSDSISIFNSKNSTSSFFSVENQTCYYRGSTLKSSKAAGSCVCRRGYYGGSCSIPDPVWSASLDKEELEKLRVRSKPRRIVQTLLVNNEFDLFEARVRDHWDTVDVFLVLESKYTAYGNEKDSPFFDKLKQGWLSDLQDKIFYIYLDFFHEKGRSDGWFADSYPRVYMGEQGLTRIEGLQPDDLIIYNDADEIPDRSTLEFLKHHDGYSEPIEFIYRWTVFGYYWLSQDKNGVEQVTKVTAAATWKLVNLGLQNNIWAIRNKKLRETVYAESIANSSIQISPWTIGSIDHYAGYHCSWCMSIRDIQTKLSSAQSDDGPRWGDFPDKLEVDFIQSLRESGTWFDLVEKFKKVEMAPAYVLENFDKFKHILIPP